MENGKSDHKENWYLEGCDSRTDGNKTDKERAGKETEGDKKWKTY
jgi:hypothetical protein